jgi:hypothetical protein
MQGENQLTGIISPVMLLPPVGSWGLHDEKSVQLSGFDRGGVLRHRYFCFVLPQDPALKS